MTPEQQDAFNAYVEWRRQEYSVIAFWATLAPVLVALVVAVVVCVKAATCL